MYIYLSTYSKTLRTQIFSYFLTHSFPLSLFTNVLANPLSSLPSLLSFFLFFILFLSYSISPSLSLPILYLSFSLFSPMIWQTSFISFILSFLSFSLLFSFIFFLSLSLALSLSLYLYFFLTTV